MTFHKKFLINMDYFKGKLNSSVINYLGYAWSFQSFGSLRKKSSLLLLGNEFTMDRAKNVYGNLEKEKE